MKLFLHGKLPKIEKLKMQQILLKSRFEALAYKYDGRTICESEYSRLPKNTDLGFIFVFFSSQSIIRDPWTKTDWSWTKRFEKSRN